MKKFEKEIEALKKIEHTPEELAELSRIDEELEEIAQQEEKLREERRKLNTEYSRFISNKRKHQIEDRLKDIRQELESLSYRKREFEYFKRNVFQHIQGIKRAEAEKRLSEVNEELRSIAYETQAARNNVDKAAFDQLQEKRAQAEKEKAEIEAAIAETNTEKSEMERAVLDLRAKMEKQTAKDAFELFDKLAGLVLTREKEEQQIREIEAAYNCTEVSYDPYIFSSYSDLNKILSNSRGLIEKIRMQAEAAEPEGANNV